MNDICMDPIVAILRNLRRALVSELEVCAMYEAAIYDAADDVDRAELQTYLADHRERAGALRDAIATLGGTPAITPARPPVPSQRALAELEHCEEHLRSTYDDAVRAATVAVPLPIRDILTQGARHCRRHRAAIADFRGQRATTQRWLAAR
jgi:hypothetical protein